MNQKKTEDLEHIVSYSKSPSQRVRALLELSSRFALNDLMRSWMLAREAERDADVLGERKWIAKANTQAGNALWKLGDYLNAQKHFIKAVAHYIVLKDHDGLGNAYCGLGIVHGELRDYPNSLEYFKKGMHESDLAGNKVRSATNLGNIASVYLQLEEYDKALEYFEKGLALKEEQGDMYGVSNMLGGIAGVKVYQGKFDEGAEHLKRQLELCKGNENNFGIATTLMNFGILYHKKNDYRKALDYLEQALLHAESTKIRSIKGKIHKNFGEVYTDMGKSDEALEHYKVYFQLEKETRKKEVMQKTELFNREKSEDNDSEQQQVA